MYSYHKELYLFDSDTPRRAVIRNYTAKDFPALIDIQRESFPPPFPSELWWKEEQLLNHAIDSFARGAKRCCPE